MDMSNPEIRRLVQFYRYTTIYLCIALTMIVILVALSLSE